MKNRLLLFVFLLGTSITLLGQKVSIRLGVGNGIAFSSNHGDDKGRILFMGAGYFHSGDQLQFGIEANYSGSFIGFVGGDPSADFEDPNTGTLYLNPTNTSANSFLGKVRYTLSTKKAKPFLELGIGTINYFSNIHVNDEINVNRHNFSLQPEIGIQAGHFQFSMRYVPPGKTPSFDAIYESTQQHVVLESITVQQLLITVCFSFSVLK